MANLTRYDPFGDIARFEPFRDIEDFVRNFHMAPAWRGADSTPSIRIEIAETDQAYALKADIPGVKKEDIKVAIVGAQVTISAELRRESEQQEGSVLRNERFYGKQSRSFSLPQEVDDAQAVARYSDGVLELTLPKKSDTGPTHLKIQ